VILLKYIKEIIKYILIVIFVVLFRLFIITPIQIHEHSMEDTLYENDVMILNIIGYQFNNIKRFDIIVFNYNNEKLIKRVIGLPGEMLEYKNNNLYINNKIIAEPFLSEETADYSLMTYGYDKIPDNKYFVLGDNRNNSTDSRYIGFINKKDIIGKASFILYPFNRIGLVD
jgi:signal peptidase I